VTIRPQGGLLESEKLADCKFNLVFQKLSVERVRVKLGIFLAVRKHI